ncbi:MAG: hypothetical protein GY742_09340 [Hyphomicrobiales bacterium]|nr:hypothetical protein [Hyphomicrobiales bacterium]
MQSTIFEDHVPTNIPAGASTSHRHRLPNLQNKFQTPQKENSNEADAIPAGNFRLIVIISLILALLMGAVKLVAGYAGAEFARAGHTISTVEHKIIINSDVVTVPANMIRYPSQRRMTAAKKLNLYFHWPTMEGYSEDLEPMFNDLSINSNIIFVTLMPRFSPLDMTARVDPIYEKFIIGPPIDLGNGLVSQRLDSENGYINEYLIVEKNSPAPYAARCVKPDKGSGAAYCIRDIQIGNDLSLTYRFHSDIISQWFELDQNIIKKFNAMIN